MKTMIDLIANNAKTVQMDNLQEVLSVNLAFCIGWKQSQMRMTQGLLELMTEKEFKKFSYEDPNVIEPIATYFHKEAKLLPTQEWKVEFDYLAPEFKQDKSQPNKMIILSKDKYTALAFAIIGQYWISSHQPKGFIQHQVDENHYIWIRK